jgi:hypothetical protein
VSRLLRPAAVDAAAVVVLVLIASTAFDRTFDGPGYLLAAALGAGAGLAAAALVRRTGAPGATLAIPVLSSTFLVGPPLIAYATRGSVLPGPDAVTATGDVLLVGWKDLLTTLPPVPAGGRLAVLPFLVAAAGAAPGYFLARRTWHPYPPVAGPLAAFAAAAALGAGAPGGITPRALGFGFLAVLWGAARRARLAVNSGGHRHRAVAGAALLAVAGLAAGLAAPALAGAIGDRGVLRTAVAPPVDLVDQPSPLAGFRRFRPVSADLADEALLTVSGLPRGSLIRLATVDSYAGTVWAASATDFLRVGSRIDTSRTGPRVSGTVTIGPAYARAADLRIWVPTVGDPTRLTFTGPGSATRSEDLRYNPVTRSAVVPGGLVAGDTYRVDAVLPDGAAPTSVGVVGTPTSPSRYLDVVTRYLTGTRGAGADPLSTVRAVAQRLRTTGAYTDGRGAESTFTAGHSLGRLTAFLADDEPAGNDEQYAATLALVANSAGLPARVVLGAVPDGTGTVRGRNVHAYVEVQVDRDRWWTIPPEAFVPPPGKHPRARHRVEQNRAEDAVVPPPNQQRAPSSLEGFSLDTAASSRSRSAAQEQGWTMPGWLAVTLKGAAVPTGAVLGWTLLALAVKAVRRAGRARRGSPADRVAAAWTELVDLLTDARTPIPRRHTRTELAALTGAEGVTELAQVCDRSLFGPEPVTAEDAGRAWSSLRRAAGQLAAAQSWIRRWRRAVSPRSLLPQTPRRPRRP